MENNKSILINFSLYFLTLLLIIIIGISNVFALTYTNIGEMKNVTTVLISPEYSGQPFEVPSNSSYAFNEVLEVDYIVENYNFVANKNYQLESYLAQQRFTNVNRYSVQTDSGKSCLISYDNSILNNDAYPRWAFQCPENTTRIVISLSNSNGQYLWGGTGIFDWRTALLKYSDTSLSGSGSDSDNIINNQNQNTQTIINNQNQNTDKIIEDNKKNFQTCRDSYNLSSLNNYNFNFNNYFIDKILYMNYEFGQTYTLSFDVNSSVEPFDISIGYGNNGYATNIPYTYKSNVNNGHYSITFTTNNSQYSNIFLRIPRYNSPTAVSGTVSNIMFVKGNVEKEYEPYGEEICVNKLDEQTNAINGLNDSINDDNTDGATSEASEFFSDFNTNTFGLTSIITAPLNLIQSLTSKTCTPLHLPLPYLNNKYLDLPCMSIIYSQHFGTFFTIYQTITYGIIAYWVVVRIFNHVKDFKNPEHDEIEVVDL